MKSSSALRAILAALALTLLAGCMAAAGPSAPAGSASPPASSPGGSGGGSDPGGSTEPIGSAPGDPGDPGNGGQPDPGLPTLVVPQPGQLNVHPVAIEEMDVRVEGRHAVLNARWWSGVEPCYVLDSTAWKRDGQTITISVREGNSAEDVVCIDIAMYKATIIDLGELEPGEYTVVAGDGNAAPITFTID